ncbi:MAG TPA: WecB/TagA/CpsF family glycosyltransferase [Rhizomicrobium sp.]|jgi:exopolysaccharide biosynthesis WecB/TagA/CpsF family protein|nr:WecB/TagA/CpsF family glycosyltransferase [Rhizomicrobium sp.]
MRGAFQTRPQFVPAQPAPRAIPDPANDRYAEVTVGGIKTACVTRDQLAMLMVEDCLIARKTKQAPKLVFASNGHAIALVATDKNFREHFAAADIVHADGQPVVMASRLLARQPVPERSATTDFIHDAARAAQAHGLKIFLLGATEQINAQCAEILRFQYPDLKIAGRRNGYFTRGDEAALCDEINASGADIVFVGLGVPLEYEFCTRNKHRLNAGWVVTCGGCYNFVTGAYKRAPEWMQKFSLEWLYRLAREPKRLLWRYAVTNPLAIFFMVTRTA